MDEIVITGEERREGIIAGGRGTREQLDSWHKRRMCWRHNERKRRRESGKEEGEGGRQEIDEADASELVLSLAFPAYKHHVLISTVPASTIPSDLGAAIRCRSVGRTVNCELRVLMRVVSGARVDETRAVRFDRHRGAKRDRVFSADPSRCLARRVICK